MKIQDRDGISKGLRNKTQAVHGKKIDAPSPSKAGPSGQDHVELSERAKAMQAASAALKQLPETRSDKVERLKESIKKGKYQVSGEQIAERLLEEPKA